MYGSLPGRPSRWKLSLIGTIIMTMAGCTALPSRLDSSSGDSSVTGKWHATLPEGAPLEDPGLWWRQFDDPLLLSLLEAAQAASSTIAEAGARIADARVQWVSDGAVLIPSVEVNSSSVRGRVDTNEPTGTVSSIGLMSSWELDLFGGNRAGLKASRSRLASSEANWHAAKIAIAAEVATQYSRLRACEARLEQVTQDAQSRLHTAHLTGLVSRAGLAAPIIYQQAKASAAQGETLRVQQEEQCDLWLKMLVSLSGMDEVALRQSLKADSGTLPRPAAIQVPVIPAKVLAQRPDVRAAEQDVIAAGADVVQADARRLPRISLSGSIGFQQIGMGGMRTDGRVWQIGPVAISMPLFDGGQGRANADAARIRQQAVRTTYAAVIREAIREVESALVELDGSSKRKESAQTSVDGFSHAYLSWQSMYKAGMASLLELEDARRSKAEAQRAFIDAEEQQVLAWISLYRALGGGWKVEQMQYTLASESEPVEAEK